jgi:predicted RNA binding protein YcfA (HicA-like mRNA interferase family)
LAFVQGSTGTFRSLPNWLELKRQSGSHKTLSRPGWPGVVFAFHDGEEIGPRMLARIAKRTGLTPDDL